MCFCKDKNETYDKSIPIEELELYCCDWALRKLGFQNETIICNTSGFIANVFLSKTKSAFINEELTVNRKSLLDITLTNQLKTNDITIQNDYCRKVTLTDYNFYATIHLFYGRKWNQVFCCKKFDASQDIIIEPLEMEKLPQDNHI